jgi:hypothetical protein
MEGLLGGVRLPGLRRSSRQFQSKAAHTRGESIAVAKPPGLASRLLGRRASSAIKGRHALYVSLPRAVPHLIEEAANTVT